MKLFMAVLVLLGAFHLPAYSQEEKCSEILTSINDTVSVSFRRQIENIKARDIQRSSDNGYSGSGQYTVYKGAFQKNDKSALSDKSFDWLKEGTDLQYALSSADPLVVAAWQHCMQTKGGGPVAWFEVPDQKTIYLNMRYISRDNDSTAPTSTQLTQSIVLPKDIKLVQNGGCLSAGDKIRSGTCVVQLSAADPKVAIHLLVRFREMGMHVDLPPRMHAVRVSGPPQSYTIIKDVKGRGPTDTHEVPVPVPEGWYLDQGSEAIQIDRRSKGAAMTCLPQNPDKTKQANLVIEEKEYNFTVAPYAANNHKSDGAHCVFDVTFRIFRYEAQPIP